MAITLISGEGRGEEGGGRGARRQGDPEMGGQLININNIFNILITMLGEKPQTFFTVKDLPAKEFIDAFAQYLKKNNFVERPAWADLVKTGTCTSINTQSKNTLPSTRTGSTPELLPWPARFTFVPTSASACCPTFTEVVKAESANLKGTPKPQPRSSDGVSSSWRS